MPIDEPRREVPVSALLDALPEKRIVGVLPATIRGIADDSRRVERDDCFVAVPGFKADARRFVAEALGRGARLVVTEGEAPPVPDVATVLVPSARAAVGRLADVYYGHPSRDLTLVGITGTNGKTTTSYLVEALLGCAQVSSARSSTSSATNVDLPDRRPPMHWRSSRCWHVCATTECWASPWRFPRTHWRSLVSMS